jgi:hypothetical protein
MVGIGPPTSFGVGAYWPSRLCQALGYVHKNILVILQLDTKLGD